jgi:hypothetical protein
MKALLFAATLIALAVAHEHLHAAKTSVQNEKFALEQTTIPMSLINNG